MPRYRKHIQKFPGEMRYGSDVPGHLDMPQALQARWEAVHNVRIICVHDYGIAPQNFVAEKCRRCGRVRSK